ncbi:MAG: type II toxin-antitoxin system RelE/ParE family toxin [Desulfobacteraceae bacterium]
MAWQIEFTAEAEKQLSKIERQSAKRIIDFLRERIAPAEDPRTAGKALKGVLREFWRYRVGNYRIICKIEDGRLLILVVRVAHRREVYSRIR